jgi:hypothetical protein
LDGRVDLGKIWWPAPFVERPELGIRMVVRDYTRLWIKALFRDAKGLDSENQERGMSFMLSNIIYCEDNILQYMD